MPTLSQCSNVENTALLILKEKGYQVWEDEGLDSVRAEKDGWDFLSDTAVGLLGLIAIFEFHSPEGHKEYWWRIREPWILDKLPKEPKPFQSVMGKNSND